MPTKQQIEAVTQRIEWLESMSYLREEGRVPEAVSDTTLPWWEDLSRAEQDAVLRADVDWEGFTEAQEDDVIRRVLDGEEPEFWMDGITPDQPGDDRDIETYRPILEEMRADFAAREAENRPEDVFQRTLEEYASYRMGQEPERGMER